MSVRGPALVLLALVGCASGPRARVVSAADDARIEDALSAYEDFAASEGDDPELLARVAGALLLAEGCGTEPARASLAARELSRAGIDGRPYLTEIIHRDCLGSFDAAVLLSRRGDVDALRLLRGMADTDDPAVRAAVVLSLSVELDRALLFSWVADPDEAVRAASSERLGALGPADAEALALLIDRVRNDPSPRVRSHAVRALGSYEASAYEPLRERLSDPESTVRMAAVEALVRADRDRARSTLLDLLETPTSAESIEAARVLVSSLRPSDEPTDEDRSASLGYLRAALSASSASHRAQAAVVLVGLPGRDDLGEPLRAALLRETDASARLSMARALLRRDDPHTSSREAARDALRMLLVEGGMNGTQAAVVLSEENDETGLETLRSIALSGASETALRVVAVHALGRAHPAEVASALSDPDAAVRLAAASAVLAAR